MVHDQGPVGWPALTFMYRDLGVRGCLEADRLHILWTSVRQALHSAGLWGLTLSTTQCMKAKRAPFGEAGFLACIRETADHYFTVAATVDDPIFEWFYPMIAEEHKTLQDHDFGSRHHMQATWEKCKASPALRNVGECVKLARWFSWFASFRLHLSQEWATLAMIITVYGMHKTWWKDPVDMMRVADDIKSLNPSVDGSDDEELELASYRPAKSMAHNAEEVKLQHGKFKNKLMYTGLILIDRERKHLCDVMQELVSPIEQSQARDITVCKTRAGIMTWYIDAAAGEAPTCYGLRNRPWKPA